MCVCVFLLLIRVTELAPSLEFAVFMSIPSLHLKSPMGSSQRGYLLNCHDNFDNLRLEKAIWARNNSYQECESMRVPGEELKYV